ncbi:MAG: hypothetical protein LBE17_01540 [Treponema sp.]|jgi:hypothetical protein|nr:hypothetical protein [Treponema sp.]
MWSAFLYPDGGRRFDSGVPLMISVPDSNYDLGLSLFHRLRHGNGRHRHGFLFYNNHLLDRIWGRNRFSPLSLPIVFLPLNEFYLGFLNVI